MNRAVRIIRQVNWMLLAILLSLGGFWYLLLKVIF